MYTDQVFAIVIVFYFEMRPHYVTQASLNLKILYLCILGTGIAGICHQAWLRSGIFYDIPLLKCI
jgi:uncharacterized membrane protein